MFAPLPNGLARLAAACLIFVSLGCAPEETRNPPPLNPSASPPVAVPPDCDATTSTGEGSSTDTDTDSDTDSDGPTDGRAS